MEVGVLPSRNLPTRSDRDSGHWVLSNALFDQAGNNVVAVGDNWGSLKVLLSGESLNMGVVVMPTSIPASSPTSASPKVGRVRVTEVQCKLFDAISNGSDFATSVITGNMVITWPTSAIAGNMVVNWPSYYMTDLAISQGVPANTINIAGSIPLLVPSVGSWNTTQGLMYDSLTESTFVTLGVPPVFGTGRAAGTFNVTAPTTLPGGLTATTGSATMNGVITVPGGASC
jgi:hypothetical protein